MKMKKEYTSPLIICEEFQVDEYVAACGDSGTVYNFECNAGLADKKYAIKDSYNRPVTIAGKLMDGSNRYFHPCGKTHQASVDSEFIRGYHIDDIGTRYTDENIGVVVWVDNAKGIHCTTELDIDSWETTKS